MKQPARIDTRTSLEKLSGLLDAGRQQFGGLLGAIPIVGQMEAIDRGIRAAGQGNMTGVAEAAADIIPAGRLATKGIKALTKGKSTGLLGDVMNIEAPRQKALDAAQRNAALPKSQGGLGLAPDNTPMQRAKAMGFDLPQVHYSRHGADVNELDSSKFAIAPFDAVGTHTGTADAAFDRFNNTSKNAALDEINVMSYPLLVKQGNQMLKDGKPWDEFELSTALRDMGDYNNSQRSYPEMNTELRNKVFGQYDSIPYINDVEAKGQISNIVPPWNIRSRFSAFDPARRNEADLLALQGSQQLINLPNFERLLGLLEDSQ